LPAIFGHLMQLTGVRGLEEYLPNPETAMQNRQQVLLQDARASAVAKQGPEEEAAEEA